MRLGGEADQRVRGDFVGENSVIDSVPPSPGERKGKEIKRTMGHSSECVSGGEFIVSLQGQPRKLSDKKINCVLLDPCECG